MVEVCDPILPQGSFPFLPPSFQKVFPREIRNLPAHKANWLLLSQEAFQLLDWTQRYLCLEWTTLPPFPEVCRHHCLFLTSQEAEPTLPISTLASLPAGLPLPSLLTLSAHKASCTQGKSIECLPPEYVLSEKPGMEAKARKSPLMEVPAPLPGSEQWRSQIPTELRPLQRRTGSVSLSGSNTRSRPRDNE